MAPPRLQEKYQKTIVPSLKKKFKQENVMALPKLQKIVLNMGVGSNLSEKKYMEEAVDVLTQISGQKPVVTKAKKSIANFKLREGMNVGCMVTLRGARMYEFMDRLISLVLPRVRDFQGVNPKSFDGHGNYNLGITEFLVFPELNPDKYSRSQGLNVTFTIKGDSDDESREMLREFGMPFRADAPPKKKKTS
ncbi:MAG: 50S ribosomal protein L5 [Planctomycetaceae bacterium]|jgi:large subunit ribosomal protein L5|nr:50S ribosomal protein L5 [Planctomycetaceae bacterium]